MADFNSDDEIAMDPPPPPNPYAHLGAKSIEAMFESRFEDRVKTKRRMANLQDTLGSPNALRNRAIWMRRFEAYLTQIRGLRWVVSSLFLLLLPPWRLSPYRPPLPLTYPPPL